MEMPSKCLYHKTLVPQLPEFISHIQLRNWQKIGQMEEKVKMRKNKSLDLRKKEIQREREREREREVTL